MLPARKRDAVEKLLYELSPSESLIYDSKYDLFREEDLAIEERDRERDRQRRGASTGSFGIVSSEETSGILRMLFGESHEVCTKKIPDHVNPEISEIPTKQSIIKKLRKRIEKLQLEEFRQEGGIVNSGEQGPYGWNTLFNLGGTPRGKL